ncbi:hypothetical protein [Burkholderia gladioli]|uniref:hypothetical protein n=1 Tax=Burkholderia gladioli TaxID=28095 RepID=UPI00163EB5A6|nr:hypothetical protein [Burkholderia gladioli]
MTVFTVSIDSASTRDRVVAFLNEIGIETRYEDGASGFIEGCRIAQGTLLVDPACRVSAILHEAGHLAITPRCFRTLMNGNLYAGQREMLRIVGESNLHPDDPLYRAVIQCSDPEATAWAWSAGVHLMLPPEEIIRDDEYDGEGESLRLALQIGAYYGVNGLAHAGLCSLRARNGLAAWPHLHRWTQEVEMPRFPLSN